MKWCRNCHYYVLTPAQVNFQSLSATQKYHYVIEFLDLDGEKLTLPDRLRINDAIGSIVKDTLTY